MTRAARADDQDGAGLGGAPADDQQPERAEKRPENGPQARFTRRVVFAALGAGLILGAGGGFAGGYFFARPTRKAPKPMPPAFVPLAPHSPRAGPDPAKVTLVEFTDFQCPYCGRASKVIHDLRARFPEDLAVVLRHRPLSFHKQARGAAIALQAANLQGKAWQLYPILFENKQALQREHLLRYAADVELDVARFEKDLDEPELAKQVDADGELADRIGAMSTPTVYVNGHGIRGAKPSEAYEAAIKDEIAAANQLLAEGVPLAEVYKRRCEANVAAGPR